MTTLTPRRAVPVPVPRLRSLGYTGGVRITGGPWAERIADAAETHVGMSPDSAKIVCGTWAAFDLSSALLRRIGDRLGVATRLSHSGTTTITLTDGDPSAWASRVRVPGWSARLRLTVDGEPVPAEPDERGWAVVRRTWTTEDRLDAPRVV